MKQRSVIPPWYLKGESSDDEPSDPEGDLPPPVAGAMRPPATGSIREHTGRRVERLLRREAREEDEVLFWQRRLKARHLPIALLRQLAADHCRVLEDLRRRAGVQLKHEAALVVQFRTRQYLEARRHAASLPPPSAASATTAASDDPPAGLSKAAHASRRFLLAASQSSSENVMVALRSEEDLAADIELATRQLASRASLLRACELRLVVTEEAHRLFESVGVAMARKVLALRRRLHLTFHRQHREAAEAAKTGAARPRNTLVLQQIFRDQEDLVACERHLRQLCSVMLSEFSEHSMTEMKTLRGDYLGSDVSPLDPPSISLRQLYLLQARVSARLRRSPRTPQSDDVVDLVKSTHWKCTRYTLDLKQDPTKVQPVVGYSDPSSLSAAADQMPLLERARMGEMLELGGSSVHISCEVLAQRRRDETLRERNMLREKLQQLQEVQESLARCQAARPRRNSAVSSFNQRATTPPSSPPSSRAKANTHVPKLCGSCRVLCSRDLAGPPGRPGVFTRGASGPDSLARYIGHRTQSATRLADAWPGRKDEDSAHEARQPERPSTVFAHIGGSQRWKAAEVRSSREASPRHQRSPRTMAPSQSQPILPGRKLRSSHSGKLPYKVLNPQPRPLNLFQATRPKTAAGVTSPRHEGTQSQGKLPICAANRNAPIVGRVRPNYRKEGVTKSSPTVIERRTELSARPPQPENAETT
ncbi:hypothetical protein AB1Y20_008706 [Prymnesium parvum]|uniref:Uncharacterized protein n=1 Tax=Prymnesium parvum TaxID=97485 RepID=A0AB34ITV3_PRYPA